MDDFFKHRKWSLAALPLVVAALVSGCGSGCGTLGVANTSSCGSSSSSTSATSSTYSMSGTVSGSAPSGVTLTLTGAGTGTTVTDTNGTYTFTALPNGSYNVVPSLSGYSFAPVSTAVTISGANVTAVSFTQTANSAASYGISGTVSGPVVQNVLITLTSGSVTTGTAVTDASGSYSFNVVAGTYTVTPSLTGYTFSQSSSTVTLSSSVTTAVANFTEAQAK
jgi:CarboxypepD_reg-like domain